MKRISISDILKAYQITNLKPKQWVFYDNQTEECGCPLTALAFSQSALKNEIQMKYEISNAEHIEQIAEPLVYQYLSKQYSKEYLSGFVRGIDDPYEHCVFQKNSDKYIGYIDGLNIAKTLFSQMVPAYYYF